MRSCLLPFASCFCRTSSSTCWACGRILPGAGVLCHAFVVCRTHLFAVLAGAWFFSRAVFCSCSPCTSRGKGHSMQWDFKEQKRKPTARPDARPSGQRSAQRQPASISNPSSSSEFVRSSLDQPHRNAKTTRAREIAKRLLHGLVLGLQQGAQPPTCVNQPSRSPPDRSLVWPAGATQNCEALTSKNRLPGSASVVAPSTSS